MSFMISRFTKKKKQKEKKILSLEKKRNEKTYK
jgi:hypothetical protein